MAVRPPLKAISITVLILTALAFGPGCAKKASPSTDPTTNAASDSCPTLTTASLSDCTPSAPAGGSHTGNVLVSWTANHEKGVNTAGGGYRVEYSTQSDFPAGQTVLVNVPYVSGPTAPVSKQLTGVPAGNYCIRVTAFSTLNPTGSFSLTKLGVP